jgi:hypothetical protein
MFINNLNKLEKIIKNQYQLNYPKNYKEWIKEKGIPVCKYDLPIEFKLDNHLIQTGYIDKNGKFYECNSCEHERIIQDIIHNEYEQEFSNIDKDFYNRKPIGMFDEEYFAMKYLKFVKISSFEETPLEKVLIRYDSLTTKQIEKIYIR